MEEACLIKIGFNEKLLSLCENESEIHKSADYWLPYQNVKKFEVYLQMMRVKYVDTTDAIDKLVNAGILIRVKHD